MVDSLKKQAHPCAIYSTEKRARNFHAFFWLFVICAIPVVLWEECRQSIIVYQGQRVDQDRRENGILLPGIPQVDMGGNSEKALAIGKHLPTARENASQGFLRSDCQFTAMRLGQ